MRYVIAVALAAAIYMIGLPPDLILWITVGAGILSGAFYVLDHLFLMCLEGSGSNKAADFLAILYADKQLQGLRTEYTVVMILLIAVLIFMDAGVLHILAGIAALMSSWAWLDHLSQNYAEYFEDTDQLL